MRPTHLGLVAVLLVAAGCASPAPEPQTSHTASPDGRVEVAGTLSFRDGLHRVDLAAHNVGDRTLTVTRSDCMSPAWRVEMTGPSGQPVRHKPHGQTVGCPSVREPMPPGGWMNWTADPDRCRTPPECANLWDGRIWTGDTPRPAPAGTYTWTFTFPYSADAMGTAGPGGITRTARLAFAVEIR